MGDPIWKNGDCMIHYTLGISRYFPIFLKIAQRLFASIPFLFIAILAVGCGSSTTLSIQETPVSQSATALSLQTPAFKPMGISTTTPTLNLSPIPITSALPDSIDAGSEKIEHSSIDALVSSLTEKTWDFLQAFTKDASPRESATGEEKAASDYLKDELELLGYVVRHEPFTFERLKGKNALHLYDGQNFNTIPFRQTGLGTVTGILKHVGLARAEDIPEVGLSGRIALIQRGEILFEEKVSRVIDAGAIAAVIYNNAPRNFAGVLKSKASIPAISISQGDGERLLGMMESINLTATVSLEMQTYHSRNVVAERPGTSTSGGVLVLGAHYDTVPNTQGANDNGSGVATLIVLAEQLSHVSLPFQLRFVLFGSEEVGLFGSKYHIDSLSEEQINSIIAMLNFDVPGSGRTLEVIGDTDLAVVVLEFGLAHGIEVRKGTPLQGASSDHAPFREAGVPVLFFLADDLSRINSPRDDIEFIDPRLMGGSVVLALRVIDELKNKY